MNEIAMLSRAVANAVLALYGLPEPEGDTDIRDVVRLLNDLAVQRRRQETDALS